MMKTRDKKITADMVVVKSALSKATAPHMVLAQLKIEGRVGPDHQVVQLLEKGCEIARELKSTASLSIDDQLPLVVRALRFCRSTAFQQNENLLPEVGRLYHIPKVVFSLVNGTTMDNWSLLARLCTVSAEKLVPRKERQFMCSNANDILQIGSPKSKVTISGKDVLKVTVPSPAGNSDKRKVLEITPPSRTIQNVRPKTTGKKKKRAKLSAKLDDTTAPALPAMAADQPLKVGITRQGKRNVNLVKAPKAVCRPTSNHAQWDAAMVDAGLTPPPGTERRVSLVRVSPIPIAMSTQSTQSSAPTLESINNSGRSVQLVSNTGLKTDFKAMPMPVELTSDSDIPGHESIFIEGVGFNDSWDSATATTSDAPNKKNDRKVIVNVKGLSESFDSQLGLSPRAASPIQYVERAAASKRKLSNGSTRTTPSPVIERQCSFKPEGANRSTTRTPAGGRQARKRRRKSRK